MGSGTSDGEFGAVPRRSTAQPTTRLPQNCAILHTEHRRTMTPPYLNSAAWAFRDFFESLPTGSPSPCSARTVESARSIVAEAKIGAHPFFRYASDRREALCVWSAQECVITNHFSQVLFYLLSTMNNVHLRSLLAPVVMGEHGRLRDGIAHGAHPHLLSKLAIDMGLDVHSIHPLPFTINFADALSAATASTVQAVGIFGMSNEAFLVSEYGAVADCFARHFPPNIWRPFLRANIEEDHGHARLFEEAAIFLLKTPAHHEEYLDAVGQGVAARIRYYDDLLQHLQMSSLTTQRAEEE